MGNEREGFVIEKNGEFFNSILSDGRHAWTPDLGIAVVFANESSAHQLRPVDNNATRVISLSEAILRKKSIGQIAYEMARAEVSEPVLTWEQCSRAETLAWERVAKAVVEEHERRKR